MCKISQYPGLYAKAERVLREEKINRNIPGYEFLKRAIVIYKIEGDIPKEEFLNQIKEGRVVPVNHNQKNNDIDEVEQWMLEAIRSAGIDISLKNFIKQLAEEL